MEGLDFSGLTDDQLVELAAALTHEALRRQPAVAAAFEQAVVTERERAEAALRAQAEVKKAQLQRVEEIARAAAAEAAREELKRKRAAVMAVFVRRGADLVGRDVRDVTLVWSATFSGDGHHVYLNAGASGAECDWHLVDYCPKTESIRTSWALEHKKADLNHWAREVAAAARALNYSRIVVKGIEI